MPLSRSDTSSSSTSDQLDDLREAGRKWVAAGAMKLVPSHWLDSNRILVTLLLIYQMASVTNPPHGAGTSTAVGIGPQCQRRGWRGKVKLIQ